MIIKKTLLSWIVIGCALFWVLFPSSGAATEENQGKTPYTIIVLGDSMGDGIYAGIYRHIRKDDHLKVIRMSRVGIGLHKMNMEAFKKKIDKAVARYKPQIAVVVIGGNDPQPVIVKGGKREPFRSEEWNQIYKQRVEEYIQALESHDLKIFWVGLPIMRDEEYDKDIQYIEDIFRKAAAQHNITFVPLRELTQDQDGKYSDHGADLTGRTTKLRANDGKHFTSAGYELLAFQVLANIKAKIPDFSWSIESD